MTKTKPGGERKTSEAAFLKACAADRAKTTSDPKLNQPDYAYSAKKTMKVRITTVSILEIPEMFVEDVRANLGECDRLYGGVVNEDLQEIFGDLECREGFVESTITSAEEVKE